MLCHHCGEREATIHEVVIHQGQRAERHLCELCARQLGIVGGGAKLEAQVVSALSQGVTRPATPPSCPACGMSYAEFKDLELLGCPTCYSTFERQLSRLLERTHEGGAHHIGKVPRRALEASRAGRSLDEVLGDQAEREERVRALRKQLDEAVSTEQYERAGHLRDELRRLTGLEAGDASS